MIASEMRKKSPQELRDELLGLRKEQFNLRMQRGAGQLANPSRFKVVRHEIARIKTILNEQKVVDVDTADKQDAKS
jgi:large subunit ribosomal protein L29